MNLKRVIAITVSTVILCFAAFAVWFLFDNEELTDPALLAETDETVYTSQLGNGTDAIHFLNTGTSDAILIESNGLFALVDAGEDSNYPAGKKNLAYTGYEQEVLDYLKKYAADENGNVTLEFILGTHSHSDHIGCFDEIINDPAVSVCRAYLKRYNQDIIKSYEVRNWDNYEVYTQAVSAIEKNDIEYIWSIPSAQFTMGDFTIQFFNTDDYSGGKKIGENENSVGVKVSKGNMTAFLAGDINNRIGTEDRLSGQVGKIDLLKVGHHGAVLSSTTNFIEALDPSIAILTNSKKNVWNCTKRTLTKNGTPMYTTVENDGIIAVFTDGGKIVLDKDYCMNIDTEYVESEAF